MGIPRLTSLLAPYAEQTSTCALLTCPSHPISPTAKLIIDGPSLAHHIYYRLLANRTISSSPYAAQPSHHDLGAAFLAYLTELQARGCHMFVSPSLAGIPLTCLSCRVFFDGGLPAHKRSTRLRRLQASLDGLRAHQAPRKKSRRASIDADAMPRPLSLAEMLFDSARPRASGFRGLPAPPFLVPAILDALAESAFAVTVQVVPDEADGHCAAWARELGGVVLTTDSDLLVYDLGADGGAAGFGGVALRQCSCGERALVLHVIRTSELRQRFGIADARRLAFEVQRDSAISLPAAVRMTQADLTDAARIEFREFCSTYESSTLASSLAPQALSIHLDPRVAELILQHQRGASECHVFLPILIDNTARASAWNSSRALRSFAYSLLGPLADGADLGILEYNRRGARISPVKIEILPRCEREQYAEHLIRHIEGYRDSNHSSTTTMWRALCISDTLDRIGEESSAHRSHGPAGCVSHGDSRKDDLAGVHLLAQYQAVAYAFRMTAQILATGLEEASSAEDVFRRLSHLLGSLPRLSDPSMERDDELGGHCHEKFFREADPPLPKPRQHERASRKVQRPSNLFEILADST